MREGRPKRAIDRSLVRKGEKPARAGVESFEVIAREWVGSYSGRIVARWDRNVFPWIGSKSASTLTALEILTVPRRIENRGALETAHRHTRILGRSCARS